MTESFLIDTNIGDFLWNEDIIEKVNALIEEEKIRILVTHIQIDEWSNIPEEGKRSEIMDIGWEKIPTSGAVLDVSKFDNCRLGDGSAGGLSIEVIRNQKDGEYTHTEDSLIASTAERDADCLVTEDRRLRNQVEKKGTVKVKDKEEFRKYLSKIG